MTCTGNNFQNFIRVEHVVHERDGHQSAIVAIGYWNASGIEVWRFRADDAEWFEVAKAGSFVRALRPLLTHQDAMAGALEVLRASANPYLAAA